MKTKKGQTKDANNENGAGSTTPAKNNESRNVDGAGNTAPDKNNEPNNRTAGAKGGSNDFPLVTTSAAAENIFDGVGGTHRLMAGVNLRFAILESSDLEKDEKIHTLSLEVEHLWSIINGIKLEAGSREKKPVKVNCAPSMIASDRKERICELARDAICQLWNLDGFSVSQPAVARALKMIRNVLSEENPNKPTNPSELYIAIMAMMPATYDSGLTTFFETVINFHSRACLIALSHANPDLCNAVLSAATETKQDKYEFTTEIMNAL